MHTLIILLIILLKDASPESLASRAGVPSSVCLKTKQKKKKRSVGPLRIFSKGHRRKLPTHKKYYIYYIYIYLFFFVLSFLTRGMVRRKILGPLFFFLV